MRGGEETWHFRNMFRFCRVYILGRANPRFEGKRLGAEGLLIILYSFREFIF